MAVQPRRLIAFEISAWSRAETAGSLASTSQAIANETGPYRRLIDHPWLARGRQAVRGRERPFGDAGPSLI